MPQPLEENNLTTDFERSPRQLKLPDIELSPIKIAKVLLGVIIVLLSLNILEQIGVLIVNQFASREYFTKVFNFDYEGNIPSIYSALSLALCSILLAIVSYLKQVAKHRYVGHWKFLSLLFLFMALDEACSLHELLVSPLRFLLNARGVLYFTWVVPAFIFLAIFLLSFWRFINSLPAKTRQLFIGAGSLYIAGALGVELLGGYYADKLGFNSIPYILVSLLEETLEMLGVVVFIYAILGYIKTQIEELEVSIYFNKRQP
ncbi:MAG: hypothetical protein KME17_11500 [Cyanosarcina radialis HA8281-LM2]|jgi:hypothetical protein|nr:hypothetical protein [Cyanosarcina radialis HA8281-LM2]